MKFVLAIMALVTSLILSATAAWFSVAGLIALFAANAVGVGIMAGAIELAKNVTAVVAKTFWGRHWVLNSALITAILGIMAITSMGVYGYLMAGHYEQKAPAMGMSVQVQGFENQIAQREAENKRLEARLNQIDNITNASIAAATPTSGNAALRTSERQKRERQGIQTQIDANYQEINQINEKLIPLKQQTAGVEAKLGPVKSIMGPLGISDTEAAVRFVVLMIIPVFDPLAILLLIAAIVLFREWEDEKKDRAEEIVPQDAPEVELAPEPVIEPITETGDEIVAEIVTESAVDNPVDNHVDHPLDNPMDEIGDEIGQFSPAENVRIIRIGDDDIEIPADDCFSEAIADIVSQIEAPVEETEPAEVNEISLLAELEEIRAPRKIETIAEYGRVLNELRDAIVSGDQALADELREAIGQYHDLGGQTVAEAKTDRQKMVDILARDPKLVMDIAESVQEALNKKEKTKYDGWLD